MQEHEINIIKQRAYLERSNGQRTYKYIEIDANDIDVIDGVSTIDGFTEEDNSKHLELGIRVNGDITGDDISIGNSEITSNTRSINSRIIVNGTIESSQDVNVGNVEINNPHIDNLEINSLIEIRGGIDSGK